jgi:DNA-binding NtrC family response regulator
MLEIPLGLTLREIQNRAVTATLEYVSGDRAKADVLLGIHPASMDAGSPVSTGIQDSTKVEIDVGMSIEDVEKLLISRTLERNQGNKPKTAEILGISLKTLYNKLERYDLKT